LLHAATGWTPEIALKDGLAMTIDWWRDRLARGVARQDANYIL
jgi:UDP-glucose 4-epimerase